MLPQSCDDGHNYGAIPQSRTLEPRAPSSLSGNLRHQLVNVEVHASPPRPFRPAAKDEAAHRSTPFTRTLLVILGVSFSMAYVGTGATTSVPPESTSLSTAMSPTGSACTFTMCERSQCSAAQPFFCTDPRNPFLYRLVPGACSAAPWSSLWCAHFCDTTRCSEFAPEPDAATCKEVQCPDKYCRVTRNGLRDSRFCGDADPYLVRLIGLKCTHLHLTTFN